MARPIEPTITNTRQCLAHVNEGGQTLLQHFPVAYIGLHGLAPGYGLLLVYHLVLVVGHL
jgi:hypothetical protein